MVLARGSNGFRDTLTPNLVNGDRGVAALVGMDTDAAKELKELREQNARLKRLLAEAELEKDALREVSGTRQIQFVKVDLCSREAVST